MSLENLRLRRSLAALALGAGAVFSGVLGCQGIADIPDVSYSATCHDYCALALKACPGLIAQYPDQRTCLETCTVLDQNANGSQLTTGNTIGCRMQSLKSVAKLKPDAQPDLQKACSRGGPGGGDTCTMSANAPDCEGYCAIYRSACKGDSTNPFVADIGKDKAGTQSECVAKCKGIPPMPQSGYTVEAGVNSGDTLGCRLYYATVALADPVTNCDYAGIRTSAACHDDSSPNPSCDNFCLALTTACTGALAVYESSDQCVAVCKATEPGTKDSIETEDTVACRTAHAFNALLVKASDHCPHTGPLGANVCGAGGNCQALCALAKVACPKVYSSKFPRDASCTEDCSTLDGAANGGYSVDEGGKGGATVQCRGLAVSRVLELAEADRTAEACAPVFGGDPCGG
jgi:hypothetical protein